MRGLLILTFIFSLLGCSREESITPFSESADYRERLKKPFTIRYPLMPEQVGSYSYNDILENDPKRKNILKSITLPLKEAVYDLGVTLFRKNKVQARGQLEVPTEAFEHLKSVKLKRIFFVLDTCVDSSFRCKNKVEGISSTFISDLFISLEPYKEGEEFEEIEQIDEDTFGQKLKEFVNGFKNKSRITTNGLQLASYSQRTRPNRSKYKKYYVWKSEQKNITTLRDALLETGHIKNTVLFGDLILTETKGNIKYHQVFHDPALKRKMGKLRPHLKPATCETGNCTELKINSSNLLDYFKVNPNNIVNTFIKIKKLPKEAFNYKGFIEFEIELNI